MMSRNSVRRLFLAAVLAVSAPAMAQFPASWNSNSRSNLPVADCRNGQCLPPSSRFESRNPDYSASSIDDWQLATGSSGRDSLNDRFVRPVSSGNDLDFPELPGSLSDRQRRGAVDGRLADPFRRPSSGYDTPLGLSNRGGQIRYRVPLDQPLDRLPGGPGNYRDPAPYDPGNLRDEFDRLPLDDSRLPPLNGRDPFVPAPLPEGRTDSETQTIDELISARYQNPVNVRAVRAMSANQALQLFEEVSRRIDERALEPSSYDLRVRRGLRNLSIALDNPVFVQALGIANDSFRTDSFRNALSSAAGSMQVRSYQDAVNVVTRIMQQAQNVSGLTPSVVAFEFANASMDTLDKFSGLEPADPQGRPGASLESGTKSASLEDEIVGVGVEVKEHEQGLLVVKALRGGPAAEAGLQSGDVIIAINGRALAGMKMANSVDLMKGTAGSSMTVRIFRSGRGERDFSLTRRKVRVWTVNDTRLIDGTDVAYLSLSRFAQNSTAELDAALSELYQAGMKSLIVDLRGNPGGLLTTCVEISDRFIPCGTIVSTRGRLASDNMLEQATWQRTWSMPLVVLIDGDSASASEIFAAAVQENQRGVVVGTRSYGKGTVQTHFPLSSVAGNLRLTTARFYSPSGRPMAGAGVTPDVVVEDRDGVANGDDVLARALQIARSQKLQEMAKAAGTCRTGNSAGPRSSSLDNILDPVHHTTVVR